MSKEEIEAKAREVVDKLGENDIYMRSRYGDEVVQVLVDFAEYALSQSSGKLERLEGENKEMLKFIKWAMNTTNEERFYKKCDSLITKIESNGK